MEVRRDAAAWYGDHALILVTGGSGGLGRRVVKRLRNAGRRVRVGSRNPDETANGVEQVVCDLAKDQGVGAAVDGAAIVIHCAGVGKIKEDEAHARNLVRAARQAGVGHLVSISVVGADRIPVKTAVDRSMFAYFASQRAKELVIAESGLPWTNLRATQFYDGFILVMVQSMWKLPVIPVPTGFRFQPVDADEVADNLVQLALGAPSGQAPDIAGPKVYDADYRSGATWTRWVSVDRCSACRCPVGPRRRFELVPISPWSAQLVVGPGRTSSPQRWPRPRWSSGSATFRRVRERRRAPAALHTGRHPHRTGRSRAGPRGASRPWLRLAAWDC